MKYMKKNEKKRLCMEQTRRLSYKETNHQKGCEKREKIFFFQFEIKRDLKGKSVQKLVMTTRKTGDAYFYEYSVKTVNL